MNKSPGKPRNAAGGKLPPVVSRRRLFLAAAVGLALVAGTVGYFRWSHRTPRPPVVVTEGLDPAVAKLIAEASGEVRAAASRPPSAGPPRSGEAWGKLGSVLMHYEFVEESRFAFERAEKLSPRDPRWPYLRAILLMNREARAATTALRRAAELSRGPADGGPADGSHAGGNPPDMPRLRLAQFLAERGEDEEAGTHFQALLQRMPDHAAASLGLARLSHGQGRLADSTNHLNRCLDDPRTAKSACALLAAVQQALGNTIASGIAARRSASLPADAPWPDPFWAEAARYRVGRKAWIEDATTLMDQGRFAEASGVLNRVTKDYAEDDEGWYLLGWAFNQMQQAAEAERVLREHLRLSPQSPKGLAQLAVALMVQRRYAEAIEVLEAAVKIKPTWRELHANLGFTSVQTGRFDDALRHYRNALEQDPNHVPTHTALADLLIRRGDTGEARRLLEQARQLDPSDSRVQLLLEQVERPR